MVRVLVIRSKDSIDRKGVETEVLTALEREKGRKRTILFPIRVDEAVTDTEKGWVGDLRNAREIEDFTNWRDRHSYQAALDQLLGKLKEAAQGEAP